MIKTNKCRECDRPSFSKGYCKIHQPKKNIKLSRDTTKLKKQERQEKRNSYFEYHLEKCDRSEESFKQISNPTRANICHIFPKGLHSSVQDNLENCVYYSFEEHERFDKLLFSLEFSKLEKEFLNSWNKVCTRAKNIIPLLEESTNLSRELIKYLDGREIKS
jgi:hypothetical protein